MKKTNLNKKFAIVTGSSGDIGRAICSQLYKDGFNIIGIDISPSIRQPIEFIKFDLSLLNQSCVEREKFLKLLDKKIGKRRIDLLINNAAVQINDNLDNFDFTNWRHTFSVNIEAPLLLIKKLKTKFKKQGLTINISSIHASLTKPGFLSYSVSKAALSSLTRSLCVNHGEELRFIALELAAVETEMLKSGLDKNFTSLMNDLKKCHPTNTIAKPKEVASMISAISLKKLNFLNGSIIKMDGGISSRLHDPE